MCSPNRKLERVYKVIVIRLKLSAVHELKWWFKTVNHSELICFVNSSSGNTSQNNSYSVDILLRENIIINFTFLMYDQGNV